MRYMARFLIFLLALPLLAFVPSGWSHKSYGGYLYPQFYDHSCPKAQEIVRSVMEKAVAREVRMAASIMRLHFHDCFVKVCVLCHYILSAFIYGLGVFFLPINYQY